MPTERADLDYLRALYDAGIRLSDEAVGIVLRALEEEGLAGSMLVVITSDHGEGFRPDLGRTWHLGRLHDDLPHVPLVLRWPGGIPAGVRIPTQASAVDLLPTLLERLGVETPGSVRGQSLVPLLEAPGNPPQDYRARVYSQIADHDPQRHGSSVRTRHFKYIRAEPAGEELYDLRSDPGELRNLAGERAAHPLARLRKRVARFERTVAADRAPGAADERIVRQLRALGYVDGP